LHPIARASSADSTIMPMKKGQPPPDLKYFKQPQN
jgi:hypothetical protein